MTRNLRFAVAALAFVGLVAQPMAANAVIVRCPVKVLPSNGYDAGPWLMFYVVTYFLCAGVTVGKQDHDAKGKPVSAKTRIHGLLACLLPWHVLHLHDHA